MDQCVHRSRRISSAIVSVPFAFCGVRLRQRMSSSSWGYPISSSIAGCEEQIIQWLFLRQWRLAVQLLLQWLPGQTQDYSLKDVASPLDLAMRLKSALLLLVFAVIQGCAVKWGKWPGNM